MNALRRMAAIAGSRLETTCSRLSRRIPFSGVAQARRGTGHTGALLRGGNFNNGTNAGPLTVNGNNQPSNSNNNIGFRCARYTDAHN